MFNEAHMIGQDYALQSELWGMIYLSLDVVSAHMIGQDYALQSEL